MTRRYAARRIRSPLVKVRRDTLCLLFENLEESISMIGGCDHDVGICMCNLYVLHDEVAPLLGKGKKYDE